MKKSLLVGIFAAIAPASVMASVPCAYYTADFAGGVIPKTTTVENKNSLLPDESYYRQGFTEKGWTVSIVGSKFAAVSPTHTLSETSCSNFLISPTFEVGDEDAIVRWTARSLVTECAESYRMMVCEEGTDNWETLFSTDGEASRWTAHVASLKGFVGKKVKVAFECNSINKYMLAVTDIFAGVAGDDNIFATDTTEKFPAEGEASVSGTLLNTGKSYPSAGIQVRVGSMVMAGEMIGDFNTGDEFTFSFPVDVVKNVKSAYSVEIVDNDGNPVTVMTGTIFASDCARRQMIDEGTGMWCNNCPKAVVQLEDMRYQFPNQIITVATHANDKFAENDYWAALKFYAIPYFKANRQDATSDIKRLTESLYIPTISTIEVKECGITPDGNTIDVSVSSLFTTDTPNEAGELRIGYVVTGDFHSDSRESGIYQENGILMASGEEYYFLPTKIPADMVWLHDVTLSSATAFTGFEYSLPDGLISANKDYEFNFSIPMTDLMKEADKLNVVTFIIDAATGNILNADEAGATPFNKVTTRIDDEEIIINLHADGIRVTCPAMDGTISAVLYTADGIATDTASGESAAGVSLSFGSYSPIYLLKIENKGKTYTKKIIR